MDVPYTSHSVLTALQNLSQQTNRVEREAVLKAGLKEILKWFTLAAKNIIENKIKLPKQTTTFMTKHREEIQRLADPSIDEEIKRKIILKPEGGFLGGVIIRSLLRWDGSKTARKFGDRQPRAPRKRAPRKRSSKSKKRTSKKKTPKKKPVRMIEENDSEDDFLPMKTKKRKKRSPKKRPSKKKTPKKTPKKTKKRTKRRSLKRTPSPSSQHSLSLPPPISPLVSPPLSSPPSSYMNMSMSPRSSPKVDVVDWHAQNRRFELADSQPRVDERNITMRKKQSSVSDQPRFPLSRKALLIKNLYDLKKTNRRFLDKKRLQFQPIPSKTWSSWSASLREKYRQAKRDKAQLMHNLGRENIFFSSSPIQTERIKKRLIAKSYKH